MQKMDKILKSLRCTPISSSGCIRLCHDADIRLVKTGTWLCERNLLRKLQPQLTLVIAKYAEIYPSKNVQLYSSHNTPNKLLM